MYRIDVIKLLLDKGAYMYSKNNSHSPLQKAIDKCLYDNWDAALILFFEKGIEIKMLLDKGVYLLEQAINKKKIPIIKLLLENGVKINKGSVCKTTPLTRAFTKSENDDLLEIIKFMIQKGGKIKKEVILESINPSNGELIKILKGTSNNLLKEAIKLKNINMIKLLIQKGETNDDIFFDVIRLNNIELMQIYYDCAKPILKRDDIKKNY